MGIVDMELDGANAHLPKTGIVKQDSFYTPPSSYTSYLNTNRSIGTYSDVAWRTLIHDHKKYLIDRSQLVLTDKEIIFAYRYRPSSYFNEYHYIPVEYTWIVLYINDIVSNLEFTEKISSLYIPNKEDIKTLFDRYRSNLASKKSRTNRSV